MHCDCKKCPTSNCFEIAQNVAKLYLSKNNFRKIFLKKVFYQGQIAAHVVISPGERQFWKKREQWITSRTIT